MVGADAAAEVGVLEAGDGSRSHSESWLCRHFGVAAVVWRVGYSACWWVCSDCGTSSSHCRTFAAARDHTKPRVQPESLGT